MDPVSSGSGYIDLSPEQIQELNDEIRKRIREYPEEYLIETSPEMKDLKAFLKANRDKFFVNGEGKIVIDEAKIPPKLLVLDLSNSSVFGCVKAPWLRDRKRHSIRSIQCLFRSLNHGSFHASQKWRNLINRALDSAKQVDLIIITNPTIPDTPKEKPFGMK